MGPLGVTQLPLEDDGWMANVIGHNTTTPPLARVQSQLNFFLIFSERLCKFFNPCFLDRAAVIENSAKLRSKSQ